jgi:ketosteroid isomerase-like protein
VIEELLMHRPVILSSLLTLFVVAGVMLIAGSFLLQPPAPAVASGNTDVIRRFYAAANETIATGDTTALQAVVAPHFVDQDPVPGMKPDRGGLMGYLAALHALVPDTELLVEAVVAGDDQAMARVAVRGGQGPVSLRGAIVDQPEPWGQVDVFRIAGGKVVERWSQTDDLALIGAATEVALDIPAPTPRVLRLDRFTFEPNAGWSPPPAGPRFVFLESGSLRLEIADREPVTATLPVAETARLAGIASKTPKVLSLSAGESSLVPAGADLAMINTGGGAARVLISTFSAPRTPGGAPTADVLPPGVTSQTLAGGLATDVRVGPAALALAQVTLARNARLSLSSVDGPVLVAVESGRLTVEPWGRGWLRRGSDGVSVGLDEQVMARGDGLMLHQGGLATLQIAGDGPAVGYILTLRALETPGGSGAG